MTAHRIEIPVARGENIVTLYKRGKSLDFLAHDFSYSVKVIRRVLTEAGVTIKGRGRPRTP